MVGESEALLKETLMPVYVAPEDEQLLYMYEEVKQAAATRTSSIFIRGERSEMMHGCTFALKTRQNVYTEVCALSLLAVLRSMVTATAFQILVSNNVPIKAITDNTIVALEVRLCISVKPDCFGSSVPALYNRQFLFQGVLPGAGEDLPTIVITAHYDSYGLAPVSYIALKKHFWKCVLVTGSKVLPHGELSPLHSGLDLGTGLLGTG